MRPFSQRLKVVDPAFGIGCFLAFLAASKVGSGLVWGSIVAGPFAGLWWMNPERWTWIDTATWGVVCWAAIIAHPVRGGWITGTISAIGVAMWFFIGFALTTDGV
jgi:hypothetical protein